jgi:hypothetical protein
MSGEGQLATAPLLGPSDRSSLGERTFGGAFSGDGLAPTPDVRVLMIGLPKSTHPAVHRGRPERRIRAPMPAYRMPRVNRSDRPNTVGKTGLS